MFDWLYCQDCLDWCFLARQECDCACMCVWVGGKYIVSGRARGTGHRPAFQDELGDEEEFCPFGTESLGSYSQFGAPRFSVMYKQWVSTDNGSLGALNEFLGQALNLFWQKHSPLLFFSRGWSSQHSINECSFCCGRRTAGTEGVPLEILTRTKVQD